MLMAVNTMDRSWAEHVFHARLCCIISKWSNRLATIVKDAMLLG